MQPQSEDVARYYAKFGFAAHYYPRGEISHYVHTGEVMTKDEARKLLEAKKITMQQQFKEFEKAGTKAELQEQDAPDGVLSGPKNEIEYQRVLRDLEDSNREDE